MGPCDAPQTSKQSQKHLPASVSPCRSVPQNDESFYCTRSTEVVVSGSAGKCLRRSGVGACEEEGTEAGRPGGGGGGGQSSPVALLQESFMKSIGL